ncbi:MAG: hypothetical protein ACJ76N_04760 [Thermoanaerobaculia bacterium]
MQINERAIDPMSLILSEKAYRIWVEQHHPHVPKVANVRAVLQTLTPEEQSAALARAKVMIEYGTAVEKALGR